MWIKQWTLFDQHDNFTGKLLPNTNQDSVDYALAFTHGVNKSHPMRVS